jgi:hypothetical protein
LQRRAAVEAVRGSFGAAEQALTRSCGKVAGKRQVEQLTVAAAADIDAFYHTATPLPSSDDTLLVLSVDGKGGGDASRGAARAHPQARAGQGRQPLSDPAGQREEQGRKRMATLAPSTTPPRPAGPTTSSAPLSPCTPPPMMLVVLVVGGTARVRSPAASG